MCTLNVLFAEDQDVAHSMDFFVSTNCVSSYLLHLMYIDEHGPLHFDRDNTNEHYDNQPHLHPYAYVVGMFHLWRPLLVFAFTYCTRSPAQMEQHHQHDLP